MKCRFIFCLTTLAGMGVLSSAQAGPSLAPAPRTTSQLDVAAALNRTVQAIEGANPSGTPAPTPQALGEGLSKFDSGDFERDWIIPTRDTLDTWSNHHTQTSTQTAGRNRAQYDSARVVPEPASLIAWTMIGGAFGVGVWKRRRAKA